MVGRKLKHYKILEQIGKGGMGEVYLAEDLTLERKVALKVLPPEFAADDDRLSRFVKEAKTLAAMNHPGIVTIFSVEEEEGIHFLTMELIEGETLANLIPQGGLSRERFLELSVPIAEAVAAAHARGITHRDLKPANVMVTEDGRVKVLDFGLASAMQSEGDEENDLATATMTGIQGQVVGTVAYMSPEQAEGKQVDSRSDVFSLGILLFEMAAGKRPFEGDTTLSLLSSILRSDPPVVTDLKPELPRQLGRILSRCLKKDPNRRFQSALGLRSELEALQSESTTPVEIRKPRPGWQPLAAAAGILIVLLSGVYWLSQRSEWTNLSSSGEPGAEQGARRAMIAVLPFENLGPPEDEYFADGITEEITSRLAMTRGLGVISRDSAVLYAKTEQSTAEIGQELGVDYLLRGSVRWSSAAGGPSRVRITPRLISVEDDTHLWAGTFDRLFDDIFAIQSEIAARVVEQLDLTVLGADAEGDQGKPTENLDAYQAYLRALSVRTPAGTVGRCDGYLKRIPHLERAVELDPMFANAWAELALARSSFATHCGDHSDERIAAVRQALDRAVELAPNSWPVLSAQARFAMQIERDYDRAFELLDVADRNQVGDASLAQTKATVLRRQGRWPEAIREFKRSFELDPRNSQTAMQIASAHMYVRSYSQAIEYFDRAIGLSPNDSVSFSRKAWTWWLWRGDLQEAEATLAVFPGSANDLTEWAWFWQLVYDGKHREALSRLAKYSADWINIEVEYQPKALLAAQALAFAGDPGRARELFSEARRMIDAELRNSPDNAKLHRALAIACAGLGRKDEALR
ncbi:MAG: tetratricopeptide repeat-containing serine/threonine-protein kinase, partial [Acidobacteriota bacterium]|nr:tetratricopeptide repeat-containing serine/threonine-protein kinase [Acidobacteriota bacterium]